MCMSHSAQSINREAGGVDGCALVAAMIVAMAAAVIVVVMTEMAADGGNGQGSSVDGCGDAAGKAHAARLQRAAQWPAS